MRVYKKTLNNVEMEAYNDSGIDWVIRSTDKKDNWRRTEYYCKRKFTLKRSFELHSNIYQNF